MSKKVIEISLADLLDEREELLAKNPELIPLQNEINRKLNSAGPDHLKRAEIAYEMLIDTVKNDLVPEVEHLTKVIHENMKTIATDTEHENPARTPNTNKRNSG